MRLKYKLSMMDMGGEIAAVPVGENADEFHGMLKVNDISADILSQLEEETTPEKVHAYLVEKYPDFTEDEIGRELANFLNQLIAEGLLIAP
jgi:Coenzyme PQQ synthesis protein D (PqqD).